MKMQPGQATVVVIGADEFAAFDFNFHSMNELIDALKANQAEKIALTIDGDTVDDYSRIGKVIFSLNRHGFDIVAVNGVATRDQPPP